jgi:hypothetical protein
MRFIDRRQQFEIAASKSLGKAVAAVPGSGNLTGSLEAPDKSVDLRRAEPGYFTMYCRISPRTAFGCVP